MGTVLDEGFEDGVTRWTFSNGAEFPGAKGRLAADHDAAAEGRQGARLHYDFSGGGAYVGMVLALTEPQQVSAVELSVRKPAAARLTFRASDSSGQTCQKPITYTHGAWQRVRVRMDRWAFSWGGPADRRLRQPVRSIALLVEKVGLPEDLLAGTVDVDDVSVLAGGRPGPAEAMQASYTVAAYAPSKVVAYDLKAGEVKWVWLGAGSLFGTPEDILVTADCAGAPVEVLLRCASHFQSFQREAGILGGSGTLRELSVPAPPEGWEHTGGENDGRLHGPIRIDQLGLRAGKDGAAGRFSLEKLSCRTRIDPAEPVVVVPVHGPSDAAEHPLQARLHNLLAHPLEGALRAVFRDENGRHAGTAEHRTTLPPGGEPVAVVLDSPAPKASCLDIELSFVKPDGTPLSRTVSAGWAAALTTPGSTQLLPSSPWGMGLYLYRYPHSPEGLARMERAAALAQAAGVKWSREEILWHRTEPDKGRLDFSFYDKVVDCAHRHGISVYGLLTYWSSWTRPYTEEGIDDYCRWAAAVVNHYRDRVHHWEVWNEPNIFFWSGPKELYPVLLKKAYHAIKEADPTAKILGCSTAGIDAGFIRTCMDAAAPFDILTIHPYRSELRDDRFVEELRQTGRLVGDREVWITEMGWPTHVEGISELQQARLLARCYLCAAASGTTPNVSWYDFREDGTDPFYNEHHFGAVRHDLTPKAAYRALATVCSTLGTISGSHRLEAPDGLLAYRFTARDRPPTVAIWSTDRGVTLLLRGLNAGATARSFVGRDTSLAAQDGLASLIIPDGTPVFLPDCPEIEIAGVALSLAPSAAALRPGDQATLRLALHNMTNAPWQGRFELDLPSGWTCDAPPGRCAAGEQAVVAITLNCPADAGSGKHSVVCRLDSPAGLLRASTVIEVVPRVLVQ